MRVTGITLSSLNIYRTYPSNRHEFEESLLPDNFGKITSLKGMPYIYPISFGNIQNSSKLRVLFEYGLPCIYSGVEMIDPKVVSKMLKNCIFNRSAEDVVNYLSRFEETVSGMEAKMINLILQRSKVTPQKNIQQVLQDVEPHFRKDLYKKQAPVFYELKSIFENLPQQYQQEFYNLMEDTEKRLAKQPLYMPFSSSEFKYKLAKIKENLIKSNSLTPKSKKVINKLIKESKRLEAHTNDKTLEHQKRTIGMLDWVLCKSVLKDNLELNELIKNSKARLKNQEIVIPFSRKSFIYDLSKIIKPLKDEELEHKIISIAQKLPTSSQDFSAYVLKMASESPEKIGFRLLWPYMASVEHLYPRSCGGLNIMANFAGATTRENSERKNIDFIEQLKLKPNTPQYCQKYADRLIELYHQGIFQKHNINPKYIEDFRNTIFQLSNGSINLDISRMYSIK